MAISDGATADNIQISCVVMLRQSSQLIVTFTEVVFSVKFVRLFVSRIPDI